jgi:hypothetical protein
VIADKKESLILRELLKAFSVEMNAAKENQVPCRADKKPPVKSAVFLVKLFGIYHA